jgi:hypothetical protein
VCSLCYLVILCNLLYRSLIQCFLGGLFGGGGDRGRCFTAILIRVGVVHAAQIDGQWVEGGENYAVAVVCNSAMHSGWTNLM